MTPRTEKGLCSCSTACQAASKAYTGVNKSSLAKERAETLLRDLEIILRSDNRYGEGINLDDAKLLPVIELHLLRILVDVTSAAAE